MPEQSSHENRLAGFRLLSPLGSQTWRCSYNGGTPAAARWLAASIGDAPAEAAAHLDQVLSVSRAHLVPVLGLAHDADSVWLVSELDTGVNLHRLLQLVGLSARQAVAIAADVLDALTALHAARIGHGLLRPDNVHIGRDGRARLGDWAVTAVQNGRRTDWGKVDLEGLAALATLLARSARKRLAGPAARQDLLAVLDRIAELRPGSASLEDARVILDPVVDDAARRQARAELAALAANVAAVDGSPSAPSGDSAALPGSTSQPELSIATSRPAPPPAATYSRPRRTRVRRWLRVGIVLATLLVLTGLVAVEFSMLRERISANVETLLKEPPVTDNEVAVPVPAATAPASPPPAPQPNQPGTSAPNASAAPQPVPTPRDVPALAPAAAGPITGVAVRPLGKCVPGAVCSMLTMIRVWPQEEALQVRWDMVVVDRCTGARVTRPGGIVEVPAGGDRMDGMTQVAMPAGTALAVVAITSMPGQAASPAVLIPAAGGTC